MKFFYLFITAVFLYAGPLSAQSYQWGKVFGDAQNDRIVDIQVDDDNNVYLAGEANAYYFDLNPGPVQEIIENNTINTHGTICFLVKLDADGNYVWGKVFNPVARSNSDRIFGLKIGTDNKLYTMMQLRRYGNGSLGESNNIIAKMDLNGNELMVKDIKNQTSQSQITIQHFDLDSANNFYVSGYFVGAAVFDLANSGINLTTSGAEPFILKTDNQGNFLWSKKIEASISGHKIKVGNDGNINFIGLNGIPGGVVQNLLKINSTNGNTLWQKDFTHLFPTGLTVDLNGNYIITSYRGDSSGPPSDIDPSVATLFTTAPNLVLWLDQNGNLLDYKEYEAATPFTVVYSDSQNNTYIAKTFGDTFDADPSPNVFNLTSSSLQLGESLVIKFDPLRNFENAFKLGQPNIQTTPYDNIYSLDFLSILVKDGFEYYAGSFAGVGDIDPTVGVDMYSTYHNAVSTTDGFAIKIGNCVSTAPQANVSQTFCSGQNATVNNLIPNSASIKWYDSPTSPTQLSASAPLVNNQIYYAARQSGTCPETSRTPVTVTIEATPAPLSVGAQTFCGEMQATLADITTGGLNVKWYDAIPATSSLPLTTPVSDGNTYYVTQTVNGCESLRTAVPVTVITTPPPVVGPAQNFCFQDNKTLGDISISGQNIVWYDAATAGNLAAPSTVLTDGTTFFVSQTDNGCESIRVPVSIHIQQTAVPTGDANQVFCITSHPTLDDVVVIGNDIAWYSSAAGNTALPSNTALVDGNTYYAAQVLNGCESAGRLPVSVSVILSLNANDYAATICDNLNDEVEMTDLTLYQPNLISSLAGYSFAYYTSQSGAQAQNPAEKVPDPGNYRIAIGNNVLYTVIISPNGCQQIVMLSLTLVPEPVINLKDTIPLCENSSITIDGGNGFDSYLWSTGSHAQVINVSQTGIYSLTVTESHGSTICSATKNFSVVSSGMATITDIIVDDFNGDDNTVTVNVSGNGSYEYSIDGINYQADNVFNNVPSGFYKLYVKDKNGCGTAKEDIYVMTYPKFFTPNGDGVNDFWKVKYSFTEPDLQTTIFDRYGQLIISLKSGEAWDGTLNGQNLPTTDYWFVIKRKDGNEYTGHFSLKR